MLDENGNKQFQSQELSAWNALEARLKRLEIEVEFERLRNSGVLTQKAAADAYEKLNRQVHELDKLAVEELKWPTKINVAYERMLWAQADSKEARRSSFRWFNLIELLSRALPPKVRIQAFEPAYQDAKAEFLKDRRRYRSRAARRWLAFWFAVHAGLMALQCMWGMVGDGIKRAVFACLPDSVRKFLRS